MFQAYISVGLGVASTALFVAEVTGMEVLPGMVSSLGVLGALVWYLYYTTTKTLPDINRHHDERIEQVVKANNQALLEVTTDFTTTLKEEREFRRREMEVLLERIKTEAACRYKENDSNNSIG